MEQLKTLHSAIECLPEEEREVLAGLSEESVRPVSRDFFRLFFPRLMARFRELYSPIDLDAAFALLEDERSELEPYRLAFWSGEELTPLGDAFFSWAETSEEGSLPEMELQELEAFFGRSEALLEALAPKVLVEEESAKETEPEDFTAVEELSEELEERPEEEFEEEPEFEIESEELAAEEEVAQEPEELAEGEEPDTGAEPEPEPEEEPESPPSDITEQETLALGALARAAVARAEREAVRKERIQAILKTTLEASPALLQTQFEEGDALLEEVAEVSVVEAPTTTPDRMTQLKERSKARALESMVAMEEGEELEFSRAPLSPFEKQNQLIVRNKFLGYGKNTEGVVGLCGQLRISYFEEAPLVGRLESSNPLLFLLPSRLSGTSTTVTYWLPPVAFPHPAGHISIKTRSETKTLALHTLFPKSRTDYLRDRHVVLALLAPAIVGFLYFAFVFFMTASSIDQEARSLFPDLYNAALSGVRSVDFRSGGLGLYRLKVVPAAESLQMIWAGILLLAPLASSKFFHYLSRSRKRLFGGTLAAALLAPSIFLLIGWNFQEQVLPLFEHKDFAPLDLKGFLAWGLPTNVAVAAYLFLSNFGVWDRVLKSREARLLLPIILTGLYLLAMFFFIYGRSWFS